MRIIVIIPTYNERDNIVKLIDKVLRSNIEIDVLVVDDNSPDGTSGSVKKNFSLNPRVNLITRTKKDGRGGAVMEGIKYAIEKGFYDKIIEMDADFSHNPEELSVIIEKSKKADIVIGSRYLSKSKIIGWSIQRRIFSKLANFFARIMLNIPISDYTNGYRCYSLSAAKSIEVDKIRSNGYIVLSEIAYQLHKKGFKFADIPTLFVNRERGISNLNINEILSAFKGVWNLRFNR